MNAPAAHPGLRPMVQLQTAWNAPWMLVSLSQQGLGHYQKGIQNMDAYALTAVGATNILVVADGVGSKPNSHRGSRAAARAVERHISKALTSGDKPSQKMLQDAFAAAHDELAKQTAALNIPISDYATTLCAAIVTDDAVHTATIGDSSIVLLTAPFGEGEGKLGPACSAPQPKQKGATLSIVNANWPTFTAFNETKAGNVKAVLLASDGGENFFTVSPPSGETAFEEMFLNAFDHALKVLTPRAFCNFFSEYIRDNEGNNVDDRTILIAYRVPADLAPPPQVT